MLFAPSVLSDFWPASVSINGGEAYQPQATWLGVTACVCLLMALRPASDSSSNSSQTGKLDSVSFLLLGFGVWCGLSAFGAVYRHDALLELSRVGGCLAWFFIARGLLSSRCEDENTASVQRFIVLGVIVLGTVLVTIPAVLDFVKTRNSRQFGTFYNPNLFANFCAMAIPLGLALTLEAWRAVRRVVLSNANSSHGTILTACALVCSILILAIAAGLAATSSKGGFLAVLAALLVFVEAGTTSFITKTFMTMPSASWTRLIPSAIFCRAPWMLISPCKAIA